MSVISGLVAPWAALEYANQPAVAARKMTNSFAIPDLFMTP
jgi:hypothetical protein